MARRTRTKRPTRQEREIKQLSEELTLAQEDLKRERMYANDLHERIKTLHGERREDSQRIMSLRQTADDLKQKLQYEINTAATLRQQLDDAQRKQNQANGAIEVLERLLNRVLDRIQA